MPLISVEAMNASLANDYGPDHGPNSPDSLLCAIYTDDPRFAGVEMDTDGGYARVAVAHSDFETPADGKIKVTVQFADATDAWTAGGDAAKGTWWALLDADTEAIWDADALDEPVVVTGPGTLFPMPVVIYHPDVLDPEE